MRAAGGDWDDVLEAAGLGEGDDVLDLGSGAPPLAFGAHALVGDGWVIAVDPSVDALEELLRASHESGTAGIMYLVGEADVLPLPDGAVDACIGRFPSERVADAAAAVAELARVLRPGGRLSLLDGMDAGESQLAAALRTAGFADVSLVPAAEGRARVAARRP